MKIRIELYLLLSLGILAGFSHAQTADDGPKIFEKGVLLKANGEPISVTTGHAAPYIYDFDRDGVQDLLVGEFGSGLFKGEKTSEMPMANARVRIYLNHGTNQNPEYKDFTYLQAGGENASVPNT